MYISSLAAPFPTLYFTSPWLFCNYLYFLIPSPLQVFSPSPLPSGYLPVTKFSSLAFKNLSLSLTFGILIMICFGVGLFASIIIRTLHFLDLDVYFLHQIKEVFFHYFFLIDFQFLAFSLLLLAPYGMNVGPLEVAPEAVYTILIF